MDIYNNLCQIVTEDNVAVDEPMNIHTTFKIGGTADYYVRPDNSGQVTELLKLCKDNNVRYHIHGNGSNVLFSDEGYRGVVICIGKNMSDIRCQDSMVTAGAGISLAALAAYAASNNLAGLEFASGIPGTLGGAVTMNAGAYGGEMKDVLVEAKVCDRDGNIIILNNEELKLGYRTSIIQKKEYIVLEARLRLTAGNEEDIKVLMKDYNNRRRDKQPLEYGSAGSTFKRPEGHYAGQLIEESGLKGYRFGDAMVSEKHAGFVINIGNASAKDVLAVIKHVQEEVYKRYNIMLETEVKII